METPVFACTLPPPELRARRLTVLRDVRHKALHVEEEPAGFTFVFARSPALEAELAEFVRFESECCSFIAMEITPRGEDALALRMTSVPEAKPLLRAEFVEMEASACGCDGGCTAA